MIQPAAWIQAVRPLAQLNIALPLLFGQALAFAALGRFSLGWMYLAGLFGLLVQLVIVFVNDFADRETDRINTTFARFSGGSRVLPEGKLSPALLRRAALVALAAMMLMSVAVGFAGRPWAPVLALAAALLVWAYNHPPLRLAYRGNGELAQGLGTGVVLPLVGYYFQAGTFTGLNWAALVPMVLLGYVGNILTALPDVPSDKASGKLSYPVRRGQWLARRHALELLAMATAMSGLVLPGLPTWGAVVIAVPVLGVAALAVPLLGSADAENRRECERFVMLAAGASQLLVLLWALVLVGRGLFG
ncbi:MAG: prenyltransferase [Nannocystis sp.]|nr:prenyltransferase [Nannocystis sp.]MBA3548021.1 prenyltransferase [Nannocystis sp.]